MNGKRFSILAVLLAVLLWSTPVWAATFTVNTTGTSADSNPGDGVCGGLSCSLRAAITEANAYSGADTIEFDATVTGTISSFRMPIITESILIAGPGSGILTVDALTQPFTIFRINSPGNDQTVTMRDLTVTGAGGSVSDATNGGGFYVDTGDTLNLDSVNISNNRSDIGGGIYNNNGNVTLTNCIVSGNTVYSNGGGIYNSIYLGSSPGAGSLTIIDSIVSGNTATTGDGPGIYNDYTYPFDNVSMTIINSTIGPGNTTANGKGGGIYNSTNTSSGNGTVTLTDSTVSGNNAFTGGGIHNSATLNINNSTISGNTALGGGGGIYNFGTVTLTDSTVSGNTTISRGGGIFHNDAGSGSLDITNATIFGNEASEGGGIYNLYATLNVTNSTISGNMAYNGGGGIYDNQGISEGAGSGL